MSIISPSGTGSFVKGITPALQKDHTGGAQSAQRLRLSVINGLRGLAILAVIYQHAVCTSLTKALSGLQLGLRSGLPLGNLYGLHYGMNNGLPLSALVFKDGWIGVNLFFILSGFVLFLPYYRGHRKIGGISSFLDFYKRRWSRLMPLFLFNCLICAFVAMRYQPFWWDSFWRTITTCSMYSDVQWFPAINPALWSLMLEIYFSLLCPVLILSVTKLGWVPLTTSVFTVALVARAVGFSTDHIFIYDGLFARLDDFLTGMLLCKIFFEHKLRISPSLLLLLGSAFLAVGTVMCDMRMIEKTLPLYLAPFINNVLQAGLFALVLGTLRSSGVWRALFTSYPLQMLGMMCYSVYIWHLVMLEPLTGNWITHPIELVHYALFILGIAALSYRYIEFGREKDWRKLFTVPSDAGENSG